jgi:hypothetical protein
MSSKSRIEVRSKALAALVALGALLGGCSDIYFDRRETVALGANDHVAVNRVAQMVDPWPRYVANKNLAFNGERLQAGVERYRHHEVIRPISPTTTTQNLAPPPITTEAIEVRQTVVGPPAAAVR